MPDAEGRTILIENVPAATYYVFQPSSGWTAQPMVLPTGGWTPPPVARMDAGNPADESGLPTYERMSRATRERRAPALNFFPIVRERLDDRSIERHRDIVLGDVGASLFRPPFGVSVTERSDPGSRVSACSTASAVIGADHMPGPSRTGRLTGAACCARTTARWSAAVQRAPPLVDSDRS